MSGVSLTVKDAWRQLVSEGVTAVGYHAFRLWVKELFGEGVRFIEVERESSGKPSQLELLRKHAALMARGRGTHVKRNAQAKLTTIRHLAAMHEPIQGSKLLNIAELYGSVSPATLYRRGVRASDKYSKDEARNLICGGMA